MVIYLSSLLVPPFFFVPLLFFNHCLFTVFYLPVFFLTLQQQPPELVHGQPGDNVVKMAPEVPAAGHGGAPQGGPIHVEAPAPVEKKDHPPEQASAPGPPQNQAKETIPEAKHP